MGFKMTPKKEWYYSRRERKDFIMNVRSSLNGTNNFCGYLNINGKHLYCPKELIGKRVRIKLELVED